MSTVRPSTSRVNVVVRPRTFTSLPVWTFVAALATATAGWATWSAASSGAGASAAPRSPAEARQEEILKEAIERPGDRHLGQLYQSINLRHFGGAIPSMPVIWEPRLEEVGTLAGRTFTLEGMFGRLGDRTIIMLHPKLQSDPRAIERALCHEMVHAYLFALGDSSTDHGLRFQALLKRLADEGAFVGVVGSDEERERLRVWLDTESARLEVERKELDRMAPEIEQERLDVERAMADLDARVETANRAGHAPPDPREVESVSTRRDAYNRHAANANERAERYRAALAEFQGQMERYNLMVVYPDGVDHRTPAATPASR